MVSFTVESEPDRLAVGFARVLRRLDIATPLDSVLTFINALSLVGIDNRESVYWAGRATLVRRPEDISTFDKAFAVFWEHRESVALPDDEQLHITLALDSDEEEGSARGRLRGPPFALG